jgi:hypothetical protein
MERIEKTEFGELLTRLIREKKMTQSYFYEKVGIAKPYFYDLLTSAPPPPEIQKKMISVLENKTGFEINRRNKLLNLAAQGRNEIPADIERIIKSNVNDWDYIREILAGAMSVSVSNSE